MKNLYLYAILAAFLVQTGCDMQFAASEKKYQSFERSVSGTLDANGYAEVSLAEAPRHSVVVYCVVDNPEAESGHEDVSCNLKGQTGSLLTIISEGQAYANRGYQVDWYWNDPTKFAD